MKVLVVGSGGREHALCWALKRDHSGISLLTAPGNAGTAALSKNIPIGAESISELVALAELERPDLVIVGPEAPLALGLADRLRERGLPTFGPSAGAAQIEASKAWAKDVMAAAGVPTAASKTFRQLADALAYIDSHSEPLVVKASGLAAGKGAVVCATRAEARRAAEAMLVENELGEAGAVVVIEAFLEGEELSVLAITDGRDLRLLPAAQDHKRLLEGDHGPNTGGMGAYSPVSVETATLLVKARSKVFEPTLAELERRGSPFSGVLYAGLMVDRSGDPWVVEFNCRLGDPETQVILPRVTDGLLAALLACATGQPLPKLTVSPDAAVTTVLAARGYPGKPDRGAAITIPDVLPNGALVFHAGTSRSADQVLRTAGGRVLAVTGMGPSFAAAQDVSRSAAEMIEFEGKQYRRDIGWRELNRSK